MKHTVLAVTTVHALVHALVKSKNPEAHNFRRCRFAERSLMFNIYYG